MLHLWELWSDLPIVENLVLSFTVVSSLFLLKVVTRFISTFTFKEPINYSVYCPAKEPFNFPAIIGGSTASIFLLLHNVDLETSFPTGWKLILHSSLYPLFYMLTVDALAWICRKLSYHRVIIDQSTELYETLYLCISFYLSSLFMSISWVSIGVCLFLTTIIAELKMSNMMTPKVNGLLNSVEHAAHLDLWKENVNLGTYTTLIDKICGTYYPHSQYLLWREEIKTNPLARPRMIGFYGFVGWFRCAINFILLDMNDFWKWMLQTCNVPEGTPIRWIFLNGKPSVFVTKPNEAKHIFNSSAGEDSSKWVFSRNSYEYFLQKFGRLIPHSLITSSDVPGSYENWKDMRARTMTWMKGPYLEKSVNYMKEVLTQITLPKWKALAAIGDPIDLKKTIFEFSSIVSFNWVLGIPHKDEYYEIYYILSEWFDTVRILTMSRMPAFLLDYSPNHRAVLKRNKILCEKMSKWLDTIMPFVLENYPNSQAADIVKEYSTVHSLPPNSFDKEAAYARIRAMLVGGSETTLVGIQRGLYEISLVPNEQEKLAASLESQVDFSNKDSILNLAVKEVMRLAHPAYVFLRVALKDCFLGEWPVSKDTIMWGSQFITHRMKTVWGENAETFCIERWRNPTEEQRNGLLTFIFGPRMCIGKAFAEMETSIVLHTLLRNFKIQLPPGTKKMTYNLGLTMRPENPVFLVLTPRN